MSEPERPTVLAVDDEPNNLELLQRALRHRYRVITACSGEEALELLDRHPFICILSDQNMPGMSGPELLGICRERKPEAIRVLLTGYSDIDAVIEAINRGQVSSYVRKPYHADELLRVVAEAHQLFTVTRKNRLVVEDLERRNVELEAQRRLLSQTVQERTERLGEVQERLGSLATRDGLTGLSNHRHFTDLLGHAMRQSPAGPVTILLVDLDGFGGYDETQGSPAADELLVRVAGYLEEATQALAGGPGPEAFALARFAGDQFAMAFRASAGAVTPIAARLQQVIASLEVVAAETLPAGRVTACIGAAEFPADAGSRAELVRCAVRAVHAAKRQGPGHLVRHAALG